MSRSRFYSLLICLVVSMTAVGSVVPPSITYDEDAVRVLFVHRSGLNINERTAAINFVIDSWYNTGLDFGNNTGTDLEIANGGVSLQIPNSVLNSGSIVTQYGNLKDHVEELNPATMVSLRDEHGADVVVGLTTNANLACGWAEQHNWTGSFFQPQFVFNPAGSIVDLTGRNDSYVAVAVVKNNSLGCDSWAAAHEFGHLFGAAHHIVNFPALTLNPEARATYKNVPAWRWPTVSRKVTAMAGVPGQGACGTFGASNCVREKFYSDGTWGSAFPYPDFNNAATMQQTSRSVANYRAGQGTSVPLAMCLDGIDNDGDALVDSQDPDCATCNSEYCPPRPPTPPPGCSGTQQPTNFVSQVLQVCVPGTSKTQYRVSWSHVCPSSVFKYRVWTENPTGSAPGYLIDVGSRNIVFTIDGTATVKFRAQACNSSSCGSISSQGINVVDIC